MGPEFNDTCPRKRKAEGDLRPDIWGEGHVKVGEGAEIRVMQPRAKGWLEPPEAARGKEGLTPRDIIQSVDLLIPWFQTLTCAQL